MTFSRRFASRTARWLLYVSKIVMHAKSKRFHSTRTVNFTCIFSIFYLAMCRAQVSRSNRAYMLYNLFIAHI